MSLLLDALKRAEQEKNARHGGAEPAAPARGILAAGDAPSALELAPLNAAGGIAHPAAAHRPEPAAHAAHAAQNVFQAKTAGAAAPAARSRKALWFILAAIGLAAIVAAGYIWYSINTLTPRYAAVARPPPPATGSPLPPTAAMGSIVPSTPPPAAPGQPAAGEPAASAPAAARASAPSAPPATAAERLLREAARAPTQESMRMERSNAKPRRVPSEVAAGYAALQQGNLESARREYQAALAADPADADALLGLATIAARESNRAAAVEHYRRALEVDPRNGTALAGLAALADFSRPEALEMQLRTEVARLPDSAALQFTLGNLYASQSRWTEAQAAYFEAHRLDPGSADIAHNLAVSLDRLGQRALAANFYRRALDSARGRAAQFDVAAVRKRLEELR